MSASSSQTSVLRFPCQHQKEAYSHAVTPAKDKLSPFTVTDDCWGSQIGNSIPDVEEVDYGFRSTSGFLVLIFELQVEYPEREQFCYSYGLSKLALPAGNTTHTN